MDTTRTTLGNLLPEISVNETSLGKWILSIDICVKRASHDGIHDTLTFP
jgi:hypothetical protein